MVIAAAAVRILDDSRNGTCGHPVLTTHNTTFVPYCPVTVTLWTDSNGLSPVPVLIYRPDTTAGLPPVRFHHRYRSPAPRTEQRPRWLPLPVATCAAQFAAVNPAPFLDALRHCAGGHLLPPAATS